MLWKALLFFLFVGTVTVDSAWGPDRRYVYNVKGRSVTALHQVADHYVGIMIKAQLAIEPTSFQQIRGKLSDAMFAQINMAMPSGWDQKIPDSKLQWQPLPMIGRSFEMTYNNGKVQKMIVSGSTKEWEVNMLKGILSSLQVNVQGVRNIRTAVNDSINAVFKAMESTVTGECEVGYDVAPLPALVAQDQPELAPLANVTADKMFDIVKTQNFGKCKQRRAFHFGLTGFENFEPGQNKMGSFMSRSSLTRVVVSGSLKNFTIQSSVTTNKVLVSPEMFNSQQGISASRINLTLVSISQRKHIPAPENPRNAGDLVYRYNNAFGSNSLKQDEEFVEMGYSDDSGLSWSHRYRRSIKHQDSSPESKSSSSSSTSDESDKSEDNNEDNSSESNSSSSSEDLYQRNPQNGSSTNIPLLPFFIGQQGNAVNYSKYIDPVQSVINMAIRIGSDLQNASSIPVKNTLARFSIMINLIRIMNHTQLEKVTSSLYTPEPPITLHASYNISVWRKSWKAFRDAVSEAGTLSALSTISDWIRSNKIREEEAAQVVAVLPRTAITPNHVYLKIFSEMVKNNSTRKQNHLNSTAILSLANLIRKAVVNKVSARDNYPVYVFGKMILKNMSIMIDNCTNYLANSLNEAIHTNDSQKSQVFIRAFGNIACPKILQYFKPYLEGRKNATNFQRLLMVVALDKMAEVHPEEARRVLYRIYQNVGELYEIRCASVFLLMKTNPPVTMLQRMAEFTHSDPDQHVVSAVKSVIEYAANLKGPAALQLSRNAKAAVNLLNPKDMDIGYSRSILKNHRVKDMSLGYLQSFNYIGSTDSIIPKSMFVNIIRDLGGSRNEYVNFAGMVSSVQDAAELLKEQFQNKTQGNENNRSHKSSKKSSAFYRRPSSGNWTFNLDDLLNITHDHANRVEGNFLFNFAGSERFFAFDSTAMKDIPRVIKEMAKNSIRPRAINFTKLYNEHNVILSFPNAMGLPTLFTLETPTLLQVGANVFTRSHPDLAKGSNNSVQIPQTINITADVQFVYSAKKESKIGFITPFDSMRYIAGLDRNFQVNLPVRASVNVNISCSHINAILQPINNTANHAILHWSALPYTAKHNILSMKPANEGKYATVIHVRPTKSVHMTLGQDAIGMAFNIHSETDKEFVDMKWLLKLLQSHDMVSAINSAWMMQGINYCNTSIIYNARKSSSRIVQFSAAYENNAVSSSKNNSWEAATDADSEIFGKQHKKSRSRYKRNSRHGIYVADDESDEEEHEEGKSWGIESSNPANATIKSPDSHARRQEFLRKAEAATGDGYASVIDVCMAFLSRSSRKATLVATAAYSTSKINGSSSLLIFVDAKPATSVGNMTKLQVSLSANASMPQVPFLDFHQALKANPNSSLTAKLNIDQNDRKGAQVTVKASMQRSEEKKQSVANSPMAHLCEKQMADENYLLPACRNVTEEASNLDQLHMWVKLNNLPDSWRNMTYKAYALARQWAFPQVTENIFPAHPNRDELELDVKLNNNSSAFNVSIESSLMDVTFTNIRLPPWVRQIVEINPQHSALNRLSRSVSPIYAFPICVIDGGSIRTFDNKTYSLQLDSCWHVMMKYIPKSKRYALQEATVLVRGNLMGSEKALMILLGKTTINMTTSFTQTGVHSKITVNGTVLKYDEFHPAKVYVDGRLILQLYSLAGGRVFLIMPNNSLQILFDGRRVLLQASNQYRHQVRGLCGTMDGEVITDFKTPKGCIVKDPYYFAASYAITNYSCEGWARKLKANLSAQPCVSQRVCYTDLISNSSRTEGRIYGKPENAGQSSSSSSSSESASSSESSSNSGSNSSSDSESVESTSKSSWRSNSLSEVTGKYNSSFLHPVKYPSLSCTVHRTKVIEDGGEICFSMGPLPECSPQCSVAQEFMKPIRFHCLPKGPTADHWSGMVNTGVNPDFSQKRHHRIIQVRLPIRCMSSEQYGK